MMTILKVWFAVLLAIATYMSLGALMDILQKAVVMTTYVGLGIIFYIVGLQLFVWSRKKLATK